MTRSGGLPGAAFCPSDIPSCLSSCVSSSSSNTHACNRAFLGPHRPSGSAPTAISLAGLRKVAAEAEAEDETLRDPSGGLGAFEAGVPPPLPGDASWGLVYCTGGCARMRFSGSHGLPAMGTTRGLAK